ncbi:unnamed protein product [Mytilus edulis]|uniref:HAT C-terminal dimerisation domain-containing protein n=1 Tax=Mytilus edulis TaxID=6550 RepID=A0A8S3VPU9_MYTED|nr:unnamed protein product [Mytilus edulis]
METNCVLKGMTEQLICLGKHQGVQAHVKERFPEASYVHCKSHCLNLAIVHSCKDASVRTIMSTVQDIAFSFDYSAKKMDAFYNEVDADILTKEELDGKRKLRTLCETRWTSRADSLYTFRVALPVIVSALEHLRQDGDDKAGQFLAAISRFEFIIELVTTEHILQSIVHLITYLQKFTGRLLDNSDRFQGQNLIPARLEWLTAECIDKLYETYRHDLTDNQGTFNSEVQRWQRRWSSPDVIEKPKSLKASLSVTNKELYPSIFAIFAILVTMPVTTSTTERSFSSLRRLKTYLRSTMVQDRLSSLALIHVHREMDIDTERVLRSFALAKNRYMDFGY